MALYHTYRPQTFADVIGQEHIITTIKNQIIRGSAAHAYLFSGPRGVGKTTSARLLAKAMNCRNRKKEDPEPCGTCTSCVEISTSRSIDVIEIDAASNTGVDHVREHIIENAQFRPTSSRYKIFIIDEVHMLSTSAFNALLKTLEEPPSHVMFILATTELHKLPETIISRCQTYHFKKIPFETMRAYLAHITKQEGVAVEPAVIERIIRKSDGCARDAVSLLDQVMATGEKEITADMVQLILPASNSTEVLEFIKALLDKKGADGLAIINTASESGVHLSQFAYDTLELLRSIMIATTAGTIPINLDLSDQTKKDIQSIAKQTDAQTIIALIDLVMKRRQEMKSSPIPDMPLQMAVVGWCADTPQNKPSSESQKDQAPPSPLVETNTPPLQKESTSKPAQDSPSIQKMVAEEIAPEMKKKDVQKKASFTKTDVENIWKTFIQKVEQEFPSLVFILNMTKIVSVENNALTLSADYSFHQDKLMEPRSQQRLAEILSETLGTRAHIIAIVSDSTPKKEDPELKELTSAFGGKVVT